MIGSELLKTAGEPLVQDNGRLEGNSIMLYYIKRGDQIDSHNYRCILLLNSTHKVNLMNKNESTRTAFLKLRGHDP